MMGDKVTGVWNKTTHLIAREHNGKQGEPEPPNLILWQISSSLKASLQIPPIKDSITSHMLTQNK